MILMCMKLDVSLASIPISAGFNSIYASADARENLLHEFAHIRTNDCLV